MTKKVPAALRYLILLLPIIAIGLCVKAMYKPGKTAAGRAGFSYGKEIVWHCQVIDTPHFRILDTPRMAVGFLHEGQGSKIADMLNISILTPKPIQFHLENPNSVDVRYRKHVCTFSMGQQSFDVINGNNLRIGQSMLPFAREKLYVTFAKDGSSHVTEQMPAWYGSLGPIYIASNASRIYVEENDVKSLSNDQITDDDKSIHGRALYSEELSGVDCSKFAIGIYRRPIKRHAPQHAASVTPIKIMIGGGSTVSVVASGVIEKFNDGICELLIGTTSFKIRDHGNIMQTPTGWFDLTGPKKYVSVSIEKKVDVSIVKPAWFAAFDKAPNTLPRTVYTVGPE